MSHDVIEALAWALVHFLWQGAGIALGAFVVGHALRRRSPEARYVVYGAALALMVAAPVVTFFVLQAPSAGPALAAQVVESMPAPAAAIASAARLSRSPAIAWLPLLVQFWMAGVAVLGVRSLGGFIVAQRLKVWKTSPAALRIRQTAARLRAQLGMRRKVRVLQSEGTEVPAALGWLRPVVLLPVSALTSLTEEQIAMVLAHELAHIRRHDYLVNLGQTAIETLLFYHPAVWWLSGRIRTEREHCCDDLAVAACGNPVGYAGALAALEGVAGREPRLVVAASGGSLLARIQRLLNRDRARTDASPAWLGALIPVAVLLVALASGARLTAADTPEPAPSPEAAPAPAPAPAAITPKPMAAPKPVAAPKPAPAATTPKPPAPPAPTPVAAPNRRSSGYLGGLADAGYTNISVDEIIRLHDNGVDPRYIKKMLAAGLGPLQVSELIELHNHGVDPEFVSSVAASGLVKDLGVDSAVALHDNGADGEEMGRIRALGFGPYEAEDVIRLRQNGVESESFAALKELGLGSADAAEAIEVRQNDVTVSRIKDMKRQGFNNMSLDQVIKLRRAGII